MGYRADAYREICCSCFRFKGISKLFDAHPDFNPNGRHGLGAYTSLGRSSNDGRILVWLSDESGVVPPTHRDVSLV